MILEAFEGKKVIGTIEFNFAVDELEIIDIFVKPDKRRQGVASSLFSDMMTAHSDAKKIYLDVRPSNGPARAFYEHLGFKTVAGRKKYYSDGEDALVMVKSCHCER